MGLKGDLGEIRGAWSKSPWWMKAWLCLSAYLSLSSIASIAETVVKWKGFVLDAVIFYRRYVSLPIRNLLAPLHLHFSEFEANVLVIYILVFSSMLRTAYLSSNNISSKLSRQQRVMFSLWLVLYYFVIIGVIVTLLAMSGSTLLQTVFCHAVIVVFAPLVYRFIAVWAAEGGHLQKRIKKLVDGIYIMYLVHIIFSVVFVAILAAFNKGIYG